VVWAMFYERKNFSRSHHDKIVARVNRLFTTRVESGIQTKRKKDRHLPQLAYNKF
jgi:hypothetical protein